MSGQTFIENHMLMDVEAQSSLSIGGHKVLSREEWLKFKPIIQQLYVDENQTYPTVARELARRFDFCPTKRQFTRKTEEWGLKKNFRKAERKLLLQDDKKNGTAEFVIGDKRVSDPKRIQRLKRRYANESPLSQDLSYQDTNIPPKSFRSHCSLEKQLPVSDCVGEIASAHMEASISNVAEENDAMDLEQWPFSWDVDVPGSPGLAQLFRLLEIEASMPPPLDLDDGFMETKQTISGNELRSDIECYGKTIRPRSELSSHIKYGYIPNTVVQPVPVPGKRIPWSPLFELDLFPNSRTTSGVCRGIVVGSVSGPLLDTWNKEIKECELKLCTMRSALPDHNPAIILSLEHLIYLYKQTRESCLHLYRRLLAARLKESCPNNYKIMEIYLDIIMELLLERKCLDATYLSRSLREVIQQSQLSSEHPFHIRLSYIEAYILNENGQYEEAESIIRLVIQKILNNQNLDRNHQMTSDALELLALLIRLQNKDSYSEAEKLYRYNIHQLSKHCRSLGDTYFDSVSHLIYVLLEDRKIEEAHSLCVYVMEYVELTLGKRHYWYYEYQKHLSVIVFDRGMISESIDFVQNILLETDNSDLRARTHYDLGYVLEKCENFREAIVMYKRCLLIEIQDEGWGAWTNAKITCNRLGLCYEGLSQFQDALFLYENLRERIKNVSKDHPFIKEVEVWISEVQERMEEISAISEELNSPHKVQQEGVDELVCNFFSEGVIDDVSLREIFEIEDRALDEKVVELGMQMTSMQLS